MKYLDQNAAIIKCLDYILSNEEMDFRENPSDNHVYYHAMVAAHGKSVADKELKELELAYGLKQGDK